MTQQVTRKISLKDRFDEIDEQVGQKIYDGYYQSCFAKKLGMWEKGEAIIRTYGGAKVPTYYQLEKQTGRAHQHLKEWHELYLEYPNKKLYLPIAEKEAGEWTEKWLAKHEQKQLDWYQSSESPEWPTPQWLFDLLDIEFHFTFDVCATKENAKCKKFYTKEQDGLSKKWKGTCWMNPPYGREIADWMAKAKESAKDGAKVVCLIPARPDTDWWWENVLDGEIRFIRGRLKWPGSNTIAPFPSAVVVLGKNVEPRKVIWWEISQNN